jgi:tRNA threonylcarbamoyladenosine biosynthesis protein TsaB
VDAKKGEIYAALFESRKEGLAELIPQGVYDPDRFFSLLPSHRIISFLGDGLSLHKSSLVAYLKDKARFPSRTLFLAHEVGLLGYEILRSKKGLTSAEVEPLYFRKSQAEEKR